MKTLALRLVSMSHASYNLFLFTSPGPRPWLARADLCTQMCCHQMATGLFAILAGEACFPVAHPRATGAGGLQEAPSVDMGTDPACSHWQA